MYTIAKICSTELTGVKSPYPTDVNVTTDQYKDVTYLSSPVRSEIDEPNHEFATSKEAWRAMKKIMHAHI